MNSFTNAIINLAAQFKPLRRAAVVAAAAAIVLVGFAFAQSARADVLELKTGEIVQGKFISASSATIRFEVNGQPQTFAIKDVLNIGFADTSDAATSPTPPPPPPPADAPPPQPDNGASNNAPQQAPPPSDAAPQPNNPPPAANSNNANSAESDSDRDTNDDANNNNNAPPAAPPPPTAIYHGPTRAITIPSGTDIVIRMIDSVDSQTNHVSDPFHASLDAPLVVGNTVVAQKGADVYGMLANATDSGHISGKPELTLELTGVRINGNVVPVDSTTYDVVGKSRGSQSAERIGGGAIVGAVIGGVIGGPKGGAVGATVGAGAGTAAQLSTHGDRIRVPSETRLEFTTQSDVTALIPASSN
jgi:hypothetical protein